MQSHMQKRDITQEYKVSYPLVGVKVVLDAIWYAACVMSNGSCWFIPCIYD